VGPVIPVGTIIGSHQTLFVDPKVLERSYLPCDGRVLVIGEYLDLFEAIGTTYGGRDEGTFQLPDIYPERPGLWPRELRYESWVKVKHG
jgi:hypothetical protein